MNRDIKFRAWNKELKIMCYDNEDKSANYWDGCYSSDIGMINHLLKYDKDDSYIYMQYTGLKDINNVEIYERDICRGNNLSNDNELFIIKFGKYKTKDWKNLYGICNIYQYGWYAEYIKDKSQVHLVSPNGVKVVGNIFENKELLKMK